MSAKFRQGDKVVVKTGKKYRPGVFEKYYTSSFQDFAYVLFLGAKKAELHPTSRMTLESVFLSPLYDALKE